MSNVKILCTSDGSHTLTSSEFGECYHSANGAIQESLHVFINAGLKAVLKPRLKVLEIGFGTGLNALLTLMEAEKGGYHIYYESVEKYPVDISIINQLNYCQHLNISREKYFLPIHNCAWGEAEQLTDSFTLKKVQSDLQTYLPSYFDFDLIYFDAFAPDTQPELWSVNIFATIFQHMSSGGVLVTYSSKGLVKQHLRGVGFTVKRLPGANGKRHMLQAVKP